MATKTNKDARLLNLVRKDEWLYPRSTADYKHLQQLGLSTDKLRASSFPALMSSYLVNKGLKKEDVRIFTFESVVSWLINSFCGSFEHFNLEESKARIVVNDRDTIALPANILSTLEEGIQVAVRNRQEAKDALDASYAVLRRTMLGYQYATNIEAADANVKWQIFIITFTQDLTLPPALAHAPVTHTPVQAQPNDGCFYMNKYARVRFQKSDLRGMTGVSVVFEDLINGNWKASSAPRTFPMDDAMRGSASDLVGWFLTQVV